MIILIILGILILLSIAVFWWGSKVLDALWRIDDNYFRLDNFYNSYCVWFNLCYQLDILVRLGQEKEKCYAEVV